MGRKLNDLTGKQFGKLKVIERDMNRLEKVYWLCECECGNIVSVIGGDLTRKNKGTKSCGCLNKEIMSKIKKKYNTYDLSGEYGIGFTSKGYEFYFDLEDYDLIKDYCWHKHKTGYIVTVIYNNKKTKVIRLHRYLINAQNEDIVDHINRKRYDNRKENLRKATPSQNCINITKRKDNSSGKTGVLWHSRDEVWEVNIGINNKQIYLGRFNNFEEAVNARKEAEKIYHKEYSPNEY
jgi:hypothetical protein